MSMKVVNLFAACLFFLSSNLIAHETKFELPNSLSNFGSSIGVNGSGNSLLAWNGSLGVNVYNLENEAWKLQNYVLKPNSKSTKWRFQQQAIDVNGNYAVITSRPDKDVFIYEWDGETWNYHHKITIAAPAVNVAIDSNGNMAIRSETNRIYYFSQNKQQYDYSIGGGTSDFDHIHNDQMDIEGNLLTISSVSTALTETYIYRGRTLESTLPIKTSSVSLDASKESLAVITHDKKNVIVYKYNKNVGWVEVDSISAIDIGALSFSDSIQIADDSVFVSGVSNFDEEYGKYPEHGTVYHLHINDHSLTFNNIYLNHDFTNSSPDLAIAYANDELFISDKNHGKQIISSSNCGALYSYKIGDENFVDIELESTTPTDLLSLGDIATFQFTIHNNSNITATNTILDIDFNPHYGFHNTKNNPDFKFISAIQSSGTCYLNEEIKYRISCKIGNLNIYESSLVSVDFEAEYVNQLKIFATAYAEEKDINYSNNYSVSKIHVSTKHIEQYATPLEFDSYVANINDYSSYKPELSFSGEFISFYTNAPLTDNTSEKYSNIYTADRYNSIIDLASTPYNALNQSDEANGDSTLPQISDNGDIIVFSSYASNLVEQDTNEVRDIFAHNRITDETYLVSVSNSGEQSNSVSSGANISANGKFIVFFSKANNLIENDFNSSYDIFIHDTTTKTISNIETKNSVVGKLTNMISPSISGDGKYITFAAYPASSTSKTKYIYLFDQDSSEIKKISIDVMPNGSEPTDASAPVISDNAQFVYYVLNSNIYLYNIDTEETKLISQGIDSQPGNGSSISPSVSADGRFALYSSSSSNLVENDTNKMHDIFIYDAETNETAMVNIGVGGYQAKGNSYHCAISADGSTIAYSSIAHNITLDDTNGKFDIFFVNNPFIAKKSLPVDLQTISTSPEIETDIGQEFEFNLYITNQSADPNAIASNILTSTTIPQEISITAIYSSIGECNIQEQTVYCSIKSLEPSSKAETITFTARVNTAGKYSVTTDITANEQDNNLENNQTEITIDAVEKVDIYITETPTMANKNYIGEKITQNYTIGNNSKTLANNITVEFEIPEGISTVSASTNDGVCQITEKGITCIISEILPLATTNITVTTKALSHGIFEIFAEVSSEQIDNNTDNNTISTQINILPKADLAVSVSTSADNVFKGDAIIYQIDVINNGLSTAQEIKIIDTIADKLTIGSIETTHGTCSHGEQIVTCNIEQLSAGETASISIYTQQGSSKYHFNLENLIYKHFQHKKQIPYAHNDNSKYIKKGVNQLYKNHQKILAYWKSQKNQHGESFLNTATVSTETPEENLENNNATITTHVAQKAYLRLLKAGRGKGTIKANNIRCENMCKTTVARYSEITITAEADHNSKFLFWAGACKGTNPVCIINMNQKYRAAIAVFR